MSNKSTGKIKWFSSPKGYGFLVDPDKTDKDIFVHFSSIEMEGYKTLKEGDLVDYEYVDTEKGPQAVKIKKRG